MSRGHRLPSLRRSLFRIGLAVCAAAMLSACSSMPKRSVEMVAVKNEAADYSRLGDGFLAAGQYASALQYYGEALDSNVSVDNVEGVIKSRGSLGRVYLAMGSDEDANREFGDALEDARAFGRPSLVALCLSNLGELRYAMGDTAAADALFAEAEPLAVSDEAVAAVVAHNRGVAAMARGDLEAAQTYIMKSAAANEKARRWIELGSNRYALASIANARGDTAAAIAFARKALESDKAAENSQGIAADLEALAKLERKAGGDAAAFDLYRRAFGVWLTLNRAAEAERCLVALNELAARLGKEQYAARYASLLERIRGK
jgi:tetratricopeptide (TPR) repeat protein